jgi:hypothetical protein
MALARGSRGRACFVLVMMCAVAVGLGWAQGTELPDAPEASKEKKEESANPVAAVADKTKDVATAGLKKARDWESGWIAGIYVGPHRNLVTLTAEEPT